MNDFNEEIVHNILRKADKPTYTSLRGVSKGFSHTAEETSSLMQFGSNGSATSFYDNYQLSVYQHQMLTHLVEQGVNATYTVIPDWQNLFIITLLYALEMNKVHEKVVLYSPWGKEQILAIIREVKDFYDLYETLIDNLVQIVPLKYGDMPTTRVVGDYNIAIGATDALHYDYERKDPQPVDIQLRLLWGVEGYYKVHPSYADEQIYSVWVINASPGYELAEKASYVRNPLTESELKGSSIFTIDGSEENPYALYSSLARLGGGEKMLINYSSYPTDYGPSGRLKGDYFLPFKFFLQLPEWMVLKSGKEELINEGLSYLELVLLSFKLDLRKEDDNLVRDWALERCSKFDLNLSYESNLTYRAPSNISKGLWVLMNPNQDICDIPLMRENLGRISKGEETRRSQERQLEALKSELRAIVNPGPKYSAMERIAYGSSSRRTYTVAELKSIARERGIKITGLTKKEDIARKILASL